MLIAGFFNLFSHSTSIPILEVPVAKSAMPEPAFQQSKDAYDAIDEPVMHLKLGKITVQLPDIKNLLSFYGKNYRPDAESANTLLHFAFAGEKTLTSFLPNEPIYLIFDKKLMPPRYAFSPWNAETPLWMEATLNNNHATIKLRLKDENGEVIQEPAANAQFNLQEKSPSAIPAPPWEIGKMRVDGTLLARQKARWFGSDKFLERHGGPEYQFALGKQRIDFGDGAESYSVFVDKDSVLVWDDSRWKMAVPGDETIGRPILVVKKIDEKLINFELWDPEGKNKVSLNLLKSNESAVPPNIMSGFHFLGAKTLSQFVFEINKERMTLAPQDWLLFVDKSWQKLSTPEEIDAYVDRKVSGYLFVFDAVEKREDRQIMLGTIFNRARNEIQHVEFVMQQNSSGGMTPYTPNRNEEGGKGKEASQNAHEASLQARAARARQNSDNGHATSYGDSETENSQRRRNKLDYDDL